MMHKLLFELLGQGANLSIPRLFVRMCSGSYNHAAVLAQLVFWSNKSSRTDGWFYKSQVELGGELELSRDQVKRSVKYLTTNFGNAIHTKLKKANGVPTTHYFIDIKELLALTGREVKEDPKPSGEVVKLSGQDCPMQGMGESTQSITDPNHIRSTDPKDSLSSKHDKSVAQSKNLEIAKTVIAFLNEVTGSKFQCCKSNLNYINGRISDGYTLEDLCQVIAHKKIEWGNDAKMFQYLRPCTLFQPGKFAGYLQSAKVADLHPGARPVSLADFDDTTWGQDLGIW
ncbi:conserved phage C-terminal domain-containing protein [Photobacterium damselae subsp. damselae]|uniref:conserved phage C-terminal domain-containing protein n=1 Tax=Photobacterium damselae TaxID=38293 RepID=UPI001F31691A|nr:conserved phage C-terminal domain-containing protein [Photobacterium damselae]UJZ95414.1 conserved phage C-terminal domain-containing protein [Photobacterium damselae subsp. damselae]UJZ99571.1 conserved phage C-terminal domain-containing protein [Photobacterium damselae subsp. damselae]UKA08679.1 conserved phage C-terminal domain-containing protein [Photobacterium damselae subsp. damselae]UKA22927.1 conserved phage C-terminal domain-containing protein [Photobacterium damselae subsp. damsela